MKKNSIHPSWCCQGCKEPIGWLDRVFAFMLSSTYHACSTKVTNSDDKVKVVESVDGTKHWSRHWYPSDKHHRTDGTAVEYAPGYNQWWVNGEKS